MSRDYYDLSSDGRDARADDPTLPESWETEVDDYCNQCGGLLTSTDYAAGRCTQCDRRI